MKKTPLKTQCMASTFIQIPIISRAPRRNSLLSRRYALLGLQFIDMSNHGTFCLEGNWGEKNKSVKPVLELMKASCAWPFQIKDAQTVDKFWKTLDLWANEYTEKYPILYLAYHGAPGIIHVGRTEICLDEIAEFLDGRATNTVFHFGSCSTVDIDKRHLRRFLDESGALAITGFKDDVDWLLSSAFDAILLDTMLHHEISARGLKHLESEMKSSVGGLCKQLEFRFEIWGYS